VRAGNTLATLEYDTVRVELKKRAEATTTIDEGVTAIAAHSQPSSGVSSPVPSLPGRISTIKMEEGWLVGVFRTRSLLVDAPSSP
jgi:hypothetical protein